MPADQAHVSRAEAGADSPLSGCTQYHVTPAAGLLNMDVLAVSGTPLSGTYQNILLTSEAPRHI
jgi:hypothetical protein